MTDAVERFEVGESLEADFEKGTWTFRFHGYYIVGAGMHAIVPIVRYEQSQRRLAEAERILRGLCDTETKQSIGPKNHEEIHSFFDPEPL